MFIELSWIYNYVNMLYVCFFFFSLLFCFYLYMFCICGPQERLVILTNCVYPLSIKNFLLLLYCTKQILWIHLFSWVSIFVDCWKLAYSWIFDFVVLTIFVLKICISLNIWFRGFFCTHENHENWYPTNNSESTVQMFFNWQIIHGTI